jgi:LysR family glycine cleavage system transcriptional activator
MVRRLPPLNSLRVFEVAARTGSFTTAADELSVSQGAVSRHIAHLEASLGARLFERTHRNVRLTLAGVEYAASIHAAFEHIEQATHRVRQSERGSPVRVRAFPNFVFRWLMPRLASFKAQHPDIQVQLIAAEESPLLEAEPVDLSVHIHLPFQSNLNYDRLFPLAIIPVCTRSTAERIGSIEDPADLQRGVLLHSTVRRRDWQHWFEAAGTEQPLQVEGLELSNSSLTYEAAINGLGIAMTQKEHAQDDLASGRLVSPWPFALKTGEYYYLAGRKEMSTNASIFRQWMISATH